MKKSIGTMEKSHSAGSSGSSSGHDQMKTLMVKGPGANRSRPAILDFPNYNKMSQQVHGRTRNRLIDVEIDSSDSVSLSGGASLTDSIHKFRDDFEDLKCKMHIFGESLNLCQCIAADFKNKLTRLEKRLRILETRLRNSKDQLNYSAIIQKNKKLSNKMLGYAKKLQMCGTEEEMREVAARICRNYLHGAWKTVDTIDLDFKRISGGLSNFLYYVALPEDLTKIKTLTPDSYDDEPSATLIRRSLMKSASVIMDEPKKVLLRIYGQVHGERAMDAIVTESVIFTLLSERRLGPRLHGVFSGGRIEEYIPARPLLTKELSEPALSMKIAEKMAAIHSMDVPLVKEPNWIWKTMGKWNKTIKEERLAATVAGKNQSAEELRIIKTLKTVDFDKELEWLKKFIDTVQSPVVFCHNDMQEGNILMLEDSHATEDEEYQGIRTSFDAAYDDGNTIDSIHSHLSDTGEPKLVLIDFEYCAYNYRGFDIANHFQEWSFDYTNPGHPFYFVVDGGAPNLDQKEIFIREYLKHYHHNGNDMRSPTIDDVNHLLHEVDAFALASHLFWCLWSVVNASKSQIPFGYWEYSYSRLECYLNLKQEVIKKDKFGAQKRKICEVDI